MFKIFVSGLSNSLMSGGYVDGLKSYFGADTVVFNKSIGGSNCGLGIWNQIFFENEAQAADLIIHEYFIMDYQTDIDFILRDLRNVALTESAARKSVILLWPDLYNIGSVNEAAVAAYHEAAAGAGIALIDCAELFREIAAKRGCSIEDLFADGAHLHQEIAFSVGTALGPRLSEALKQSREPRSAPAASAEGEHLEHHIQILAAPSDPVVGPPELKIPVTTSLVFDAECTGEIIGIMLETQHARFELVIKGRRRSIWTYWDPENPAPPAIIRFIAFPSIPVAKGEHVSIEFVGDPALKGSSPRIHSILLQSGERQPRPEAKKQRLASRVEYRDFDSWFQFVINQEISDLLHENRIFSFHGGERFAVGRRISLNKSVSIEPYVSFPEGNVLSPMGSFSYSNSEFGNPGFSPVRIGRYCAIAGEVAIALGRHPLETIMTSSVGYDAGIAIGRMAFEDHPGDVPFQYVDNPQRGAPVIGNDVWIGMRCLINPGVSIGDGAVVAAGSVVAKDVPPYAVVGGNPARFIKWRFDEKLIERLKVLRWWRYGPWQLRGLTLRDPERFCGELEDRSVDLKPFEPKPIVLWQMLQGN